MEPIALPTLPGQAARVHPARRTARHRLGADAAAAHAAGRTTPRPQRCTACCHEPAQHNLLRHPQFLDKAHCTHTPCATCVMREHELRPFHSRSARDTSGSARGHATKPQKPRSRDRDAMPTSHGNKVACNAWLRAPRARTRHLPLTAQQTRPLQPDAPREPLRPDASQQKQMRSQNKPFTATPRPFTAMHGHSQPLAAMHGHSQPLTAMRASTRPPQHARATRPGPPSAWPLRGQPREAPR
jgi:hypothetical protein